MMARRSACIVSDKEEEMRVCLPFSFPFILVFFLQEFGFLKYF